MGTYEESASSLFELCVSRLKEGEVVISETNPCATDVSSSEVLVGKQVGLIVDVGSFSRNRLGETWMV